VPAPFVVTRIRARNGTELQRPPLDHEGDRATSNGFRARAKKPCASPCSWAFVKWARSGWWDQKKVFTPPSPLVPPPFSVSHSSPPSRHPSPPSQFLFALSPFPVTKRCPAGSEKRKKERLSSPKQRSKLEKAEGAKRRGRRGKLHILNPSQS
jgi:hypothetical protein